MQTAIIYNDSADSVAEALDAHPGFFWRVKLTSGFYGNRKDELGDLVALCRDRWVEFFVGWWVWGRGENSSVLKNLEGSWVTTMEIPGPSNWDDSASLQSRIWFYRDHCQNLSVEIGDDKTGRVPLVQFQREMDVCLTADVDTIVIEWAVNGNAGIYTDEWRVRSFALLDLLTRARWAMDRIVIEANRENHLDFWHTCGLPDWITFWNLSIESDRTSYHKRDLGFDGQWPIGDFDERWFEVLPILEKKLRHLWLSIDDVDVPGYMYGHWITTDKMHSFDDLWEYVDWLIDCVLDKPENSPALIAGPEIYV